MSHDGSEGIYESKNHEFEDLIHSTQKVLFGPEIKNRSLFDKALKSHREDILKLNVDPLVIPVE